MTTNAPTSLPIALLQRNIEWEDPAANLAHLHTELADAAAAGARLIVLPEMFATGFSMRSQAIAQRADGTIARFLAEQARRLRVAIVGTLALLNENGRISNTLHFVLPDGTIHRYAKTHPFSFAGEDKHYEAGNELLTITYQGIRFTCFVCYDLRFADCFWQTATETDCYLVLANWPKPRREHWRALLHARAIENLAYVVGVNRTGSDGNGLVYVGDSVVIDPTGKRLVEGDEHPKMLLSEISAAIVEQTRRAFPALADRRNIFAHRTV